MTLTIDPAAGQFAATAILIALWPPLSDGVGAARRNPFAGSGH
jgi:hypothetical protein